MLGDNIDTDQIIPAEFLSYNPSDPDERKYFGKFANAGVPQGQDGLPEGNVPFIDPDGDGFTKLVRHHHRRQELWVRLVP